MTAGQAQRRLAVPVKTKAGVSFCGHAKPDTTADHAGCSADRS
jgi:hypothetical protein